MKLNCAITILINREGTTIELYDKDSCVVFADVKLTSEQFVEALSRLAHTECECEVHGIDKLGKKMEHKQFEFELPEKNIYSKDREKLAAIAQKLLDETGEGWVCSDYFGSKGSFFTRDEKPYARATVRRWVNKG
jgi:hypothetical protein